MVVCVPRTVKLPLIVTFVPLAVIAVASDCVNELKELDKNSNVEMCYFFIRNYKSKLLFHDPFHPTNLFFYEMFRQLVNKLLHIIIPENDDGFLDKIKNVELTHFALPILPIIKKYLNIDIPDKFTLFYNIFNRDEPFIITIYDYYYIRLSKNNFDKYLSDNLHYSVSTNGI